MPISPALDTTLADGDPDHITAHTAIHTYLNSLHDDHILASTAADASHASSTAESSALFTGTIPANTIAAGDSIELSVWGDLINNSGSSADYTLRVKFGTTTMLTTGGMTFASAANRRRWALDLRMAFPTTSSQRIGGTLIVGASTTNSFGGTGSGGQYAAGYGTASEATSSDKSVTITIQMTVNNAATDFFVRGGTLKWLKNVA